MTKLDSNLEYGKIPPQALDVEEVLLGALLLDPDSLDNTLSVLPDDAFYKEAHNIIYQAVKTIYGSGGKVDLLTVVEGLRKTEQLEIVGGAFYLSQLTSRVASGAHASEHAMIILQKFVMRQAIRIANTLSEEAYNEGCEPEDMISKLFHSVNDLQSILLSNKRGKTLGEVMDASIQDYYERKKLRQTGQTLGIKTPLKDVDDFTNGWQDSDLIILAARPSMGKTAFAISAIISAAKHGKHSVMFSIEMKDTKVGDRILIGEGSLDPHRFRGGSLLDDQEQAAEKTVGEVEKLPALIDDAPKQTVSDIWGKCRILKNKGKCDFVVIDYIGLVTPSRDRGKTREQEVSEISASLKMMAKDLDIPVMILSQLNRGVEARNDKRPKLSDLRESGSLEQDADVVIMLYRDEYYNPGNSIGVGEANITKNRNGSVGMVEFNYNSSLTRIYDQEEVPLDDKPF